MKTIALTCSTLIFASHAYADGSCGCDLNNGSPLNDSAEPGLSASLDSNFRRYNDMRLGNDLIANEENRKVDRLETSLGLRWNFDAEWAIGLRLPFVSSSYKRYNGPADKMESGSESGLGDIELRGYWTPIRINEGDFTVVTGLSAGLRLPTGSYSNPEKNFEEEDPADRPPHQDHHTPMELYEPGAGQTAAVGGVWTRLGWQRLLLDLSIDGSIARNDHWDAQTENLTFLILPGVQVWKDCDQSIELSLLLRQSSDWGEAATWQQNAGFRLRSQLSKNLSAELSWETVCRAGGYVEEVLSLDERYSAALVWRF